MKISIPISPTNIFRIIRAITIIKILTTIFYRGYLPKKGDLFAMLGKSQNSNSTKASITVRAVKKKAKLEKALNAPLGGETVP